MNKVAKIEPKVEAEPSTGLALLREPFPPNQISKLPKPTKHQTEEVRKDFKKGVRCKVCGGWHHPNVVHLDYVGHAALTDRLLDCDEMWNWEPIATTEDATPKLDANGGMWIKLTICDVTRMGYGHADGKNGGDAIKEVIGDALRNAAMRFGAALDLWHKGDLHIADDADETTSESEPDGDGTPDKDAADIAASSLKAAETLDQLKAIWTDLPKPVQHSPVAIKAKDDRKAELNETTTDTPQDVGEKIDDEIPY